MISLLLLLLTGTCASNQVGWLQEMVQLTAVMSQCMAPIPHPSPCLTNWPRCLHILSSEALKPPPLPSLTNIEIVDLLSSYEDDQVFGGGEAAFAIQSLSEGKQRLIIGFPGSTVPSDWMNNMRIWPTPFKPLPLDFDSNPSEELYLRNENVGMVHQGFFYVYQGLRKRLLSTVKRLMNDSIAEIVTVGHSLGGVLASLLMLDLRYCQLNQQCRAIRVRRDIELSTVSIGQPKMGNDEFSRFFEILLSRHKDDEDLVVPRYHRMTNNRDMVPSVPYTLSKDGYRHLRPPPPHNYYYAHDLSSAYSFFEDALVLCSYNVSQTVGHGGYRIVDYREDSLCQTPMVTLGLANHMRYLWDFELVLRQCRVTFM